MLAYEQEDEMGPMLQKSFRDKRIACRSLVTLFLVSILCVGTDVFAAAPLITDDTDTQGRGKFQLELSEEYIHDKEEGIIGETNGLTTTLTYGILDSVDIALAIPYQFLRTEDEESMTAADGISDLAIEAKWRFYEKDSLSFALKPGLTLPTGNEDKGLGTGRSTYYLYFITSKEITPWAFHFNLAYVRNENKNGERNDIWHASLAATVEVVKKLKLVGDIGVESNSDRSFMVPPAYILGGFIYSPWENVDFGLGVKGGLTEAETDVSIRGGITWRF